MVRLGVHLHGSRLLHELSGPPELWNIAVAERTAPATGMIALPLARRCRLRSPWRQSAGPFAAAPVVALPRKESPTVLGAGGRFAT